MVDVICVGLEGLARVEHARKATSSAVPLKLDADIHTYPILIVQANRLP